MAEISIHTILLFVLSLTKYLEGTKLLADLKKCGDLECETLISRVLAVKDYTGPDCLYLNFTKGEEISVYVKLAGEREDLWAGSTGKDFGYFPRDAVQVEEVFISEEVQISTTESDFLCLLGVSYMFENEDSGLNNDNRENVYPYEEDEDLSYSIYETDFQIDPEFYATPPSSWFEDQFPASEAPAGIRSASESNGWEEAETDNVEEDRIPEVSYVLPPLPVPEVQGRFGLGTEEAQEKAIESVTEPVQESLFQSRKIAVEDESDLEELNTGEPQTEPKFEPESEFESVPEKQPEQALDSEHILKPEATGWFGSGFISYLGFGEEDTGLELLSEESNLLLQDSPNSISSDEEATVPCTDILTEKEDTVTNDSSILKPSWFDFGFGMLSFAYVNEDKIISDDGKNEDSGVNKHEHPHASGLEPEEEEATKMIKITETEHQTGKEKVFEKTDASDTMPYLKKFLYNFDNPWSFENIPEETELPISKQILNQNNVGEEEETEEFSVENYLTDNVKDLVMLESRYSQSGIVSTTELSMKNHEEVSFKTFSSKNNDKKSKFPVDSEEPAQVEIDRSVGNSLPDNQMVSSDDALSSHKEDASRFQILKYLFQIDICDVMTSIFSPVVLLSGWNASFTAGINNGNYLVLVQQVAPDLVCYENNSYITNTENENVA